MSKNWQFALYGVAAGIIVMRLSARQYPLVNNVRNVFSSISDMISTEALVQ